MLPGRRHDRTVQTHFQQSAWGVECVEAGIATVWDIGSNVVVGCRTTLERPPKCNRRARRWQLGHKRYRDFDAVDGPGQEEALVVGCVRIPDSCTICASTNLQVRIFSKITLARTQCDA